MKFRDNLCAVPAAAILAILMGLCGCGVLSAGRSDFPNAARGANGQVVFVEDVDAIIGDATLTADQRRDALRELGIEDEDLIEALLTRSVSGS